MQTVRQRIIELLSQGEMDARELSREVSIREKEVYEHLVHIARSLAVKGNKLGILPAQCLSCGYVFKDRQRLTRPGRCPRCKKSHLQNPSYFIDSDISQVFWLADILRVRRDILNDQFPCKACLQL